MPWADQAINHTDKLLEIVSPLSVVIFIPRGWTADTNTDTQTAGIKKKHSTQVIMQVYGPFNFIIEKKQLLRISWKTICYEFMRLL